MLPFTLYIQLFPFIHSEFFFYYLCVSGTYCIFDHILPEHIWKYVLFSRLMTMGLALMIVPFLPATNLFFRVGFVVAERVLYLPSLGFSVLFVLGVRQIAMKYRCKEVSQAIYLGILYTASIWSAKNCPSGRYLCYFKFALSSIQNT